MSIVCAAKSNNEIAISADTMTKYGSLTVSSDHVVNSDKLYEVDDSVIGIVGWCAISSVIEHMLQHDSKLFRLGDRMEIMSTLLVLHEKMKQDYYLDTREDRDQPVESIQLHALVINKNGLFEISSYREVIEYKTCWAVGSGKHLALGAMHALHAQSASAQEIAEAGVRAAAEFDDCCCLPLTSRIIKTGKQNIISQLLTG
jgi:ATP-dependent HslUV protease subunit HslV